MAAMKRLQMEVEELWDEGYSQSEISEILKVDEGLVEDALDALHDMMYPPETEPVVYH
jgi:hypothetical protein